MNKRNDITHIKYVAVSYVNNMKPILSDEEYVDYMAKASTIYADRVVININDDHNKDLNEGERPYITIQEKVFGNAHEGLLVRLQTKQITEEIITDDSMPLAMRRFFIDNILRDNLDASWVEFKEEYGILENVEVQCMEK